MIIGVNWYNKENGFFFQTDILHGIIRGEKTSMVSLEYDKCLIIVIMLNAFIALKKCVLNIYL